MKDLEVTNHTKLNEVEVAGNLTVGKNLVVEGDQHVKGNSTIDGDQHVKGNSTIDGNQHVKGDQTVDGNQHVKGDQTIDGNQHVKGNSRVDGDLVVNGRTSIKGDLDMEGHRIKNVGRAVKDTDAVNLGQVKEVVGKVDKRLRGGIAGATAVANIPQVTRPGANVVGLGVGNYNGQSAVAVGYSKMSDNGKLIIKFSAGANTSKDFNVGGGIGYQW
ncbi:YadA-like family protein [Ursidibacter sp. B-7004-1]